LDKLYNDLKNVAEGVDSADKSKVVHCSHIPKNDPLPFVVESDIIVYSARLLYRHETDLDTTSLHP
jgi:hypothetical protein